MTTLHVIPEAGLANRLRVLASAMWIAEERSAPLVLTWRDDYAISVPFETIFTNAFDRDAGRLAGRPTIALANPRVVDIEAEGVRKDSVIEVQSYEAFSRPGGPRAYTRPFWSALRPHLLSLTPVEEVRRRVEDVSDRFAPTMIGVHVRSGTGPVSFDWPDSFRVELFFDAIDRVLDIETSARIFLAADAASVVDRFAERYGSILLTADHEDPAVVRGTADNVEGLRLALADLILLSRTTFIIGSDFSSFTAMAAVLGGIPARRLGRKAGEPGRDRDLAFFVETPLLKRVVWRLRSMRHRGFGR